MRKLANTLARYASGSSDYHAATKPTKVIELLDAMDAQALRIEELTASVAKRAKCANDWMGIADTLRAELDAAQARERHTRETLHKFMRNADPVAPAQPAQPLTDDDIDNIGVDYRGYYGELRSFARKIEAHIKGQA